jgi:hypothetical protein
MHYHLNGPSGFYFRADTLTAARKHRAIYARSLSVRPWQFSAVVTIHASKSPINLWPLASK